MLRKAEKRDIPRIAEILIFTKRTTYRSVFKNDNVSFNIMQVVSTAEDLQKEGVIDNTYVFDDGIVKGMAKVEEQNNEMKICELYIDPFFQGEGIGKTTLNYFIEKARKTNKLLYLWVLEENSNAIEFYKKFGFVYDNVRKEFETTGHYILKYVLR